jgi:hypothetical protein
VREAATGGSFAVDPSAGHEPSLRAFDPTRPRCGGGLEWISKELGASLADAMLAE